MLIVDHGPWNKPQLKTAMVANTTTTGDAARDAGATVMPTDPKPRLEPDAPGPQPVHPANPVAPTGDLRIASCPRLINLVPDRKLTRLREELDARQASRSNRN